MVVMLIFDSERGNCVKLCGDSLMELCVFKIYNTNTCYLL